MPDGIRAEGETMTLMFCHIHNLMMLFVVTAIGTVNTHELPRMLLDVAHRQAPGEGNRSPFVIQAN